MAWTCRLQILFSYSTSADEGKYRMFSSNHPIPGFNRPASLYVIDGVVNVPIELDVSIEKGTTPSRTDVRLLCFTMNTSVLKS